jgi:hypothetical protein
MAETAVYLYCVVEQARRPALTKIPPGLPGATTPGLIELRRTLWAVAADVPLSLYAGDSLDERLKDINWVADIAVAHEAVVEHFASRRTAAVVPLKLFTMFSTRERAIADLRVRAREITRILSRIRGCQEWGVRVTRRTAGTPRGGATARPESGAAFLAAKKRARDDARRAALQAVDAAEAAFATLDRLARASRRHEAPDSATTPPLVDAAFLVPANRRARFRAAARRSARACREAGADLVLTGPWPAYNFVEQG